MYSWLLLYAYILNIALNEAFFADKPIFFCYKVCPLYCSPRRKRDLHSSPYIYFDHDSHPSFDPYFIDDFEDYPRFGHYVICDDKKTTTVKPTTTTPKPAPTTTEEPTWICMVCKNKCNYPKD